jgi:ABC-type uncharacterized transport system substrate-binding protein
MNIVVVSNTKSKVHKNIRSAMQLRLKQLKANTINITSIDQLDISSFLGKPSSTTNLIVTIGTEATNKVVFLQSQFPILSVAIPRLSFEEIFSRLSEKASNQNHDKLSALYLDQPLARRLDLIRLLIPKAKNVGVILGPSTQNYVEEIDAELSRRKLNLHAEKVLDETQIIKTLDRVLEKSDVMLGLIDPLVFNRLSARNVLLSAYRWRVPLIGISPSYVRAGALASVYSTPTHIGHQLAETLDNFSNTGRKILPKPTHPKYFDVSINYQVAESLGLIIEDEAIVKENLSNRKTGNK